MRRTLAAAYLALLTLTSSGCGLFGIGCFSVDADVASLVNLCVLFSGDCCPGDGPDGFVPCGAPVGSFFFPCGQGGHGGCHCFEEEPPLAVFPQSTPFASYALPTFDYAVGVPFAGMTSAHRLRFDFTVGDLQTFAGTVTYSPGFVFNGFSALGPGADIGSYGFDFTSNGTVDVALPVRAIAFDTAYVDINKDGRATGVDPTIQHLANVPSPGSHTFALSLPAGGDMAPNMTRAFRPFTVEVALAAGVFENPESAGIYTVAGSFTSVDPETGDASDGSGGGPIVVNVPARAIAIDPSPLELVDHFLCYKTKLSKGSRCGPAATANEGFVCTSDAACGGVAGACIKNKLAKGIQASLADRYGTFTPRTVDVKKPTTLCAPADKNGEGVHDDRVHLRGFAVKEAKGEAKRVASAPLQIVNQLGTLVVTIKAPDGLLEPTPKAEGGPPTMPFVDAVVDRYQCYKAKVLTKRCAADPSRACKNDAACGGAGPCLGKFPKGVQVTLSDSFASGKVFGVVKPTRLCTPALANGAPINSGDGQLLCYKVKSAAGQPKHVPVPDIHTLTPIGRDRMETVVEDELCVPSLELTTPR